MVVLGDLNMRLGKISGDRARNNRADTIYPLIRSFGLDFAFGRLGKQGNLRSWSENGASIVDYVFLTQMHYNSQSPSGSGGPG